RRLQNREARGDAARCPVPAARVGSVLVEDPRTPERRRDEAPVRGRERERQRSDDERRRCPTARELLELLPARGDYGRRLDVTAARHDVLLTGLRSRPSPPPSPA